MNLIDFSMCNKLAALFSSSVQNTCISEVESGDLSINAVSLEKQKNCVLEIWTSNPNTPFQTHAS